MKSPLFPLQYEPELPADFAERGSEMGARLAPEEVPVPDARRFLTETKNMSLKDSYRWLAEHQQELSSDTWIIKFSDIQSASLQDPNSDTQHYTTIVVQRPLHTIINLNYFLNRLNTHMAPGGILSCHSSTSLLKKQEIMQRYPWGIRNIVYFFNIIWHRVCPKLRLTHDLYMRITGGTDRNFNRVEILGRIYRAGFEVINESTRAGEFFVVARKIKEPVWNDIPSGAPIIKLRRVGKGGALFNVYKFRTMYSYSEYIQPYIYIHNRLRTGGKFNNDYRISPIGKFLRRVWIDELPMAYNLLRGQIKLVGVRPLSQHYFHLYTPEMQELRIRVKPGLLPPFYYEKDSPETLEEVQDSERRYIEAYLKHPLRTDFRYFFGILYNILFRRKKSH